MSRLERLLSASFIRFLLVGLLNTLIGLSASFLFYNAFGLDYWLSTFCGNTVGAIASYFLNRRFTFRSEASVASSWWKFALVIIVCYFVSYGVSLMLSGMIPAVWPGATESWMHNAAILIGNGIYTVLNYVGHKYFTFRSSAARSLS